MSVRRIQVLEGIAVLCLHGVPWMDEVGELLLEFIASHETMRTILASRDRELMELGQHHQRELNGLRAEIEFLRRARDPSMPPPSVTLR